MTNGIGVFLVVLEYDLHPDDMHVTINAIKQIKGVLDVTPHVTDSETKLVQVYMQQKLERKREGIRNKEGHKKTFYCFDDKLTFQAVGYRNPVPYYVDWVATCPTCGGKCWEKPARISSLD